jgi:hypothetical protein
VIVEPHTLDPTASPARRFRPNASWLVVGLCVLVVIAVLPRLITTTPPMVSSLTIKNPSPFDMEVKVTSGAHDGWTPIGTARAGHNERFALIVDQGKTWVFHFASQGIEGPEMQHSREDLVSAGWQVTVSDAVVRAFRDAGAPPSPPSEP